MEQHKKNKETIALKLIPMFPRDRYRKEMILNFERYNEKTKSMGPELDLPTMNFSSGLGKPVFNTLIDETFLKRDPKHFENTLMTRLKKGGEPELKALLLPKPQKKSVYCGVCEYRYECDYFKHISTSAHKQSFQNNKFIEELQREAEIIHEDFKKNIKEYIKEAEENPEEYDLSNYGKVENAKIKTDSEEKENIPHSIYQRVPSKQKVGLGSINKENEQINQSIKKKVGGPKVRFSNTGKLIIENDDISGSRTPDKRSMFLSQPSKSVWIENAHEGEEHKLKQYLGSSQTPGNITRQSFDNMRQTHNSWMTVSFEGTAAQSNNPSRLEDSSKRPPRRNLKRLYSMHSDSSEHDVLKKFKAIKITEYSQYSQTQSQSHSQKEQPIKIDLQMSSLTLGKWENIKKSFSGFLDDIKGRVNQFYDFWRSKEPVN